MFSRFLFWKNVTGMKYFFKIFSCIFVLLISCTETEGDDEEAYVTAQNANPALAGVWNNYYPGTDSLVMTRVFTPDFYSYFAFAEGKPQKELNKQSYTIRGDQLVLDMYIQTFKIEGDTLWITNSLQDQTTKYIKVKLFAPAIIEE